ncbi:SH3 domain-containing protein [Paenalcaligenes sp. Me52]|uniref:SH3 domain-containing protein n=1 Tax=Paenalcaligenes sp. Me52 TaxID=3392038 RepID=UPI003D2AF8C0
MKFSGRGLIAVIFLVVIAKTCGSDSSSSKVRSTIPVAVAPPQSSFVTPSPTTLPAIAQRPTRYIGPKSLNVRSSANGRVLSSLPHGQAVTIYEELNGWSRISTDTETAKWISSDHLCVEKDCSDIKKWMAPPAPPPRPTVSRSYSPSSTRSSCPCSSNSNCYGPRGGRYCITSGGNKRYR